MLLQRLLLTELAEVPSEIPYPWRDRRFLILTCTAGRWFLGNSRLVPCPKFGLENGTITKV